MNPKHVHTPVSSRARCPVCHQAVYSRAGIHPQCAVRQSEPPKPKAKPPGSLEIAAPVGVDPLTSEAVPSDPSSSPAVPLAE
jgi:hypothetical protein